MLQPKSNEKTRNTNEVEEIVETIIEKMHDAGIDAFPVSAWQADEGRKIMIDTLHHQLQKAREEEAEQIAVAVRFYLERDDTERALAYVARFILDELPTNPTKDGN